MERTHQERTAIREGSFEDAVAAERAAQDRHWGEPVSRGLSLPEWNTILAEEVGEIAEAVIGLHFSNEHRLSLARYPEWRDLRAELVQVAALCSAVVSVVDYEIAEMDRLRNARPGE